MKILFSTLMLAAVLAAASAQATTISEDQVLHATFAAFQTPGVLSEEYIHDSRTLLLAAAQEGNKTARLVFNRLGQGGRSVAVAADKVTAQRE